MAVSRKAAGTPPLLSLLLGALLPYGLPCVAAPAEGGATPSKSWLMQELHRYRSYPHLDRAYRLMQDGQRHAARREFESYLALQPEDDEVRLVYLGLLQQLKAYPALRQQASVLLSRQPKQPQALLMRAHAHQALRQVDKALRDYDQAAIYSPARSPSRRWALEQAADLAQQTQRPQQALQALTQLADQSPPNAKLALRQGLLAQQLGQRPAAERHFRQALRLSTEPQQKQRLRLNLIELSRARQDWPEAQRLMQSALNHDPRNAELRAGMADIAYAQHNYAGAIHWLHQSLQIRDQATRREFMAGLLLQEGRPDEAAAQYQRLLTQRKRSRDRHRLYTQLAQCELQLKQPQLAAQALGQAQALRPSSAGLRSWVDSLLQAQQPGAAVVALGQAPAALMSPELYYQQALLHLQLGQAARAQKPLELALQGTLPGDMRLQAQRQLAYVLDSQGRYKRARALQEQALHSAPDNAALMADLAQSCLKTGDRACAIRRLQQSLRQAGDSDPAMRPLRLQLGVLLYQEERWQESVGHFKQALAEQDDGQTHLYLGHTYMQMQKAEPAIMHLRAGLAGNQTLSKQARKALWDEVAFLHDQRDDYAEAEQAYRDSLALESDPQTRLRLGQMQLRAGELDFALATLSQEPEPSLSPRLEAERQDALALLQRKLGHPAAALAASQAAQQLAPTPARAYRQGMEHLAQQQSAEAIPLLERSVADEPDNYQYRESLAYAYQQQGRHPEAAGLLEQLSRQNPEPSRLYADIGYMKLQAGEKAQAQQWLFLAANSPGTQFGSADTHLRQDLLRLQQEEQRHEQGWNVSLYQSYRSGEESVSSSNNSGVLPSQGGVELAYTPQPFREQHNLQLFTRLLWASDNEAISPESDSLQGDIGLRYQPWTQHNLVLGAERLIKIGDDSQHDWLLRASYGWTHGYAPMAGRDHWPYSFVYTDLGYFTRDDTWAYYGEARQGYTFRVDQRLLLTPHVVINGLGQNPDPDSAAYLEGGAGLSSRLLFGKFQQYSAELLLHYKHGIGDDSGDKFVATFALQF